MKKLSLQLKASVMYTIAGLLTKGLSFITMPIFTRLLSVEQIGMIANFTSWQSILLTITTLSLGTGAFNVAMVEFAEERDKYITTMIYLSVLSTFLFFLIFICFNKKITEWIHVDSSLVVIMFAGFFLAPPIDYWLGKCRYEYKYIPMFIITMAISVGGTLCSIIAVVIAKKLGCQNLAEVKIFLTVIPSCICGLILMIVEFIKGGLAINPKYIKFALKINLPITIHSLAKHILDVSDRTMITQIINERAAGIYGTLYSISSIALILWNAINASLIPYIFDKIKNNDYANLKKVLLSVLLLFSIMSIGITMIAPEAVKILATDVYYENVNLIPPIASGIYLTALYTIFANFLLYHKQSFWIMLSTCVAAIVNIVLNSYFIPKLGMVAASYTTLASYIILTIILLIILICKKELPFSSKIYVIMSIISVVITIGAGYLYNYPIIRYSLIALLFIICLLFRRKIYILYKTISMDKKQIQEE